MTPKSRDDAGQANFAERLSATILIIDDDRSFRPGLGQYLRRFQFRAIEAGTPEEGLALARHEKPDLILLDLCLDGGMSRDTTSAERVLAALKSDEATRAIAVFAISGMYQDWEVAKRFKALGAESFVFKSDVFGGGSFLEILRARLRVNQENGCGITANGAPPCAGRILLIEDDPGMQEFLSYYLTEAGYAVTMTDRGSKGIGKAHADHPDLIILDLALPDMDGLEVCRRLKSGVKTRHVPVLILTSQASTKTQHLAAEYCADHYLTKPLKSVDEFHGWVKALLRRRSHFIESRGMLRVGGSLAVDLAEHTVTIGGRTISDLPSVLLRLLCEFARHPDQLLTRAQLVKRVWHNEVRDSQVDVAVNRLRARLGDDLKGLIEAVRGEGFRLASRALP